MQYLQRASKNDGRILSCLWTKVYEIWQVKDPLCLPMPFLDCVTYRVFFRRRPSNLGYNCEVVKHVENRWLWAPVFRMKRCPKFRTYVFKSHSLSIMRQVLVDFYSASSEGRRRRTKIDITEVKFRPKCANDYVEQLLK